MWDGLLMLLSLCVVMGTASYLAGALPLSFSLSSRQLRLITALGTGVLVGTSLIVIIPEGVETLYSASGSSHRHAERSMAVSVRRGIETGAFLGSLKHDTWRGDIVPEAIQVGRSIHETADDVQGQEKSFNPDISRRQDTPTPDDINQPNSDLPPSTSFPHDDDESPHDPHAWIGISLITGFILMYLIDTLPRHPTPHSQPQRFSISLTSFSFNRARAASLPTDDPSTPTHSTFSSSTHARPSSTTVGLLIHALADGIALGASSTTPTTRLTFIIFLALMLHKAPAAFGLTSVLLKQGLTKRMARAHLIVFSLAAPLGALFTWAAAHLLGYSTSMLGNSTSTEFATGVLLLFSGGTFLYVAMHTMQEGSHGGEAVQGDGYAGVSGDEMGGVYNSMMDGEGEKEGTGVVDTLVTVVGMLVPLLTQLGHAH